MTSYEQYLFDPYIFRVVITMSAATTSLSRLAPELINYICLYISNPGDLLSFALTCKIVSEVITPDHLELRHIRCDFRRISLWERLVQLPEIASRIVSLELVDERTPGHYERTRRHIPNVEHYVFDPILPTHSQLIAAHHSERDPQGLEHRLHDVDIALAMNSLIRAIPTMVNLTRFHWLVNGEQPTYEALFSLSNDNSALEDLLLEFKNPETFIYTTVFTCTIS